MSGVKLYSASMGLRKGANNITLSLGAQINAGSYVLEVKNERERAVARIYKR